MNPRFGRPALLALGSTMEDSCPHELTAMKEQSKTHVLRRQGSSPKQGCIATPSRPNYSSQMYQSNKSSHLSRNRVDKGTQRSQEFHPLLQGENMRNGGKQPFQQNLMHMGAHSHASNCVQDMTRACTLHTVYCT